MLETQQSAESMEKQDYSFNKWKNTPFIVVKNEEGWFLSMGDRVLTKVMDTEEELEQHVEENFWEFNLNVMIATIGRMKTIEAELKEQITNSIRKEEVSNGND